MNETVFEKKKVLKYLVWTFAIAYSIQICVWLLYRSGHVMIGQLVMAAVSSVTYAPLLNGIVIVLKAVVDLPASVECGLSDTENRRRFFSVSVFRGNAYFDPGALRKGFFKFLCRFFFVVRRIRGIDYPVVRGTFVRKFQPVCRQLFYGNDAPTVTAEAAKNADMILINIAFFIPIAFSLPPTYCSVRLSR